MKEVAHTRASTVGRSPEDNTLAYLRRPRKVSQKVMAERGVGDQQEFA